jgi:hypothetical protein
LTGAYSRVEVCVHEMGVMRAAAGGEHQGLGAVEVDVLEGVLELADDLQTVVPVCVCVCFRVHMRVSESASARARVRERSRQRETACAHVHVAARRSNKMRRTDQATCKGREGTPTVAGAEACGAAIGDGDRNAELSNAE